MKIVRTAPPARRTQTTIRVRWEGAAGYFKAVSMDVVGRQQATSTSSPEHTVITCAGKAMACAEDEVLILGEVGRETRPVDFARVTTEGNWVCVEVALKGSTTQLELFSAGGAS